MTHPKTFSVKIMLGDLLAVVEHLHCVGPSHWHDEYIQLVSYSSAIHGQPCLLNFRRCGKNAVGPKVEDWRVAIRKMELHGGKKKGKVMK